MTKVLICYHSAEYGGVETQILDIIEGLSKDFEIYVAAPNGPLISEYLKLGAKKHFDLYPKFEADFDYVLNLIKLLKSENIDVIHGHELKTGSLSMFAAYIAGTKKRIYHVHTPFLWWKHTSIIKKLMNYINLVVNFFAGNLFATDVIALTQTIKKFRNKAEYIAQSKIRLIPNGVRINDFEYSDKKKMQIRDKFNISKSDFVILNASRFTIEKGHFDLLDAFNSIDLNHKFPDLKIILAGGGPLKDFEKVKSYSDKQNFKNIYFLYKFSEEDHKALYSACDLFVFPTHAEGFGIAMIEAMAAKRPVLASNLDVLKDVAEDAAYYFKCQDPTDLGQNLVYLTNDSELRVSLSNQAYKHVQKYDIKIFWENYKNLYSL